LPPRPYTPPSARDQADSQASSPFADMLDSATAAAEPPSAQRVQSDASNRSDASQPADDGKPDAARTAAKTDAQDKGKAGANADKTADKAANSQDTAATSATDAAPATDGDTAKLIELAIGTAALDASKSDAAKAADADGKTKDAEKSDAAKTDADKTATVDSVFANASATATPAVAALATPQPVAPPIAKAPVAAPAGDAAEADALAALQAVTQQAGTAKPGQVQGNAKDLQPAKAAASGQPQAKDAAPADHQVQDASATAPKTKDALDPQAAIADASSGKDGPAHADKAPTESRHVTADLLAKLEGVAPVQGQGDGTSAVKAATDAVANLGAAGQSNQTNGAAQMAAAPVAANGLAQVQTAVPLSGLAVEIATQAHAGNSHFDIRLDPPDLGRIDVRLHVDSDGNVSTRMIADRSDTLDLLKRDASGLERALQQAGLKTSDNALQFSLRQQQNFVRDDTPLQNAAQLVVPDDDPAPLEALRQGYGRLLGLGGGLDIRV
jgi:flagellar hook-length control protein FliK